MTKEKDNIPVHEKFIWAYRQMIERVWSTLGSLDKKTSPAVKKAVEKAHKTAVELGELSQEEADKVSQYLLRDLQDAAEYVDMTGNALKDWLAFDLLLIEDTLWELFSSVADKSYLEMLKLNQRLKQTAQYHAHEVTGVGTLQCGRCGELQHFHSVGQIMPCPKCHYGVFTRIKNGEKT